MVADHMRKRRPRVEQRIAFLDKRTIGVSSVVLGELRIGIEKTRSAQVEERPQAFLRPFETIPIDEDEGVALRYGELRAHLEATGQRMDDDDLWIAATALVHDAILVTADEAFSRVPGLRTENWRLESQGTRSV